MNVEFMDRPPLRRRLPIIARSWLQNSVVRGWVIGMRHRNLTASDVFLASYPKSGNTWLRHLLTYVATGKPTSWRGSLTTISDQVGRHGCLPKLAAGGGRLIKTHESYQRSYRRAVLLIRDPRDLVVSEFNYRQSYSADFYRYGGSFERFVDAFIAGRTGGYGSWQSHSASWMDAADGGQCELLTVRFETFKKKTLSELRRIVDFIGIPADDALLAAAVQDGSIDSMRQKEEAFWQSQGQQNRQFIRGGKTGGWRQHFDDQIESKFWDALGPVMTRADYPRLPLEST